jgi:GT2 family glycosyltransferase
MDTSVAPADAPRIAVVIPTRQRPADIRRCLASLTAVRYPAWEVSVVDQSPDDQTATITRAMLGQVPGLAYHHLPQSGVSRARNAGAGHTRGPLIVFLDDDCTVPPDWLERVAAAFRRHPAAALLFGDVIAVAHDWRTEFVPVIHHGREWLASGRWALLHWRGLGACMAVRRPLFEELGGFDVEFGPGSGRFEMAEEAELMARAVRRGAAVLRTPAVSVLHYGVRGYADGALRRNVRASLRGRGAADLKLVMSGEPIALLVVLAHLWELVRDVKPLNLLTKKGPSLLSWPVLYLDGFGANLWRYLRRR